MQESEDNGDSDLELKALTPKGSKESFFSSNEDIPAKDEEIKVAIEEHKDEPVKKK